MNSYITSVQKQFQYYQQLGESAFEQLNEKELLSTDYIKATSRYNNSIALIVKHISGNMLSRWTNFYSEDGEKEWRHRETEFQDDIHSKHEMLAKWEQGWKCLFNIIDNLQVEDLDKTVYIRNIGHQVPEAINRQMMHYAYHIGQIVLIAKIYKGDQWRSLSIPLGESQNYNKEKFSQEKSIGHFTDSILKKEKD